MGENRDLANPIIKLPISSRKYALKFQQKASEIPLSDFICCVPLGGQLKLAKRNGFSLIELMVVVAIVGILSVAGVPKYQVFKAKAVVAEATSTLSSIWTAQQAFYMDNDRYSTVADPPSGTWYQVFESNNELGIIVPANSKYHYGTYTSVDPTLIAFANLKDFWTRKLASCSNIFGDQRIIWEDKTINASFDGLAGC